MQDQVSPESPTEAGLSEAQHRLAGIIGWQLLFLTILLPLKFGSTAALPEISFFPNNLMTWLIFIWPPILFPIFSSVLLLAVLLLLPPPRQTTFRFQLMVLWSLLAAVSALGFINASTRDFAVLQVAHLFGIAAYGLAAYRVLELRPDFRAKLLVTVVVAAILTGLMGLNQYFWGFGATQEHVYQEEIRTGVQVSGRFRQKLSETRVSSTFAICNSFAAHLLLTIPLCLWAVWRKRRLLQAVLVLLATAVVFWLISYSRNYFTHFLIAFPYALLVTVILIKYPEKHHRKIAVATMVLVSGLLFSNLLLTGSRAALLACGMGGGAVLILLPFSPKIRFAAGGVVLLGVAGGLLAINADRNLGSLEVRLDYFLASLKMFARHPVIGTGWGDFFHEYTRIKTIPNLEAPHTPHNLLLAFFCQTGIMGGLLVLAFMFFPIWLLFREFRGKNQAGLLQGVNIAILLGWFAWLAHAMADLNLQIAGTVSTGLLLLMLLQLHDDHPDTQSGKSPASRLTLQIKIAWYCLAGAVAGIALIMGCQRTRGEWSYYQLSELSNPRFITKEEFYQVRASEVESLLRDCNERIPYSPFPWRCAADFARSRGQWAIVEKFCQEVVNRSPERASFYRHLAEAQIRLGKKQEALENIKEAHRLFPNHGNYREMKEELELELSGPIRSKILKPK